MELELKDRLKIYKAARKHLETSNNGFCEALEEGFLKTIVGNRNVLSFDDYDPYDYRVFKIQYKDIWDSYSGKDQNSHYWFPSNGYGKEYRKLRLAIIDKCILNIEKELEK